MGNLIKVMDIEHEVVSTPTFESASAFGIELTRALHEPKTQVIMYQPGLSTSLLKTLKDQVKSHNGTFGTTIRHEESKMLPEYESMGGGFGAVDSADASFWALRNVDADDKGIEELYNAYQNVLTSIEELCKASGLGKSKVVFYLRTKNQKTK